jgi:hypothetical protein
MLAPASLLKKTAAAIFNQLIQAKDYISALPTCPESGHLLQNTSEYLDSRPPDGRRWRRQTSDHP